MKSPHCTFAMARIVNASFFNGPVEKLFAAFVCAVFSLSVTAAMPGSGGPDAFGYKWKDSDEAGGPSFNYIDISASGTPVTGLADDNFVGPFPIGFTFQFYGAGYTEFYISSNGFIGFGPTTLYNKYTNSALPTTSSPNNLVAWLWDDLIPHSDSRVYYQSFSDKLVIQLVQYGNNNSGAANERVNAEVILYSSGRILIQYLNFSSNWPLSLCTVGLENSGGTDGLTVVYNANYLHNSLAVQFATDAMTPPAPPTLVSPANGATSQPTTLTLKWNASTGATSYRLQVATDNAFAAKVFDDSTLTGISKQIGSLANNKTYFWRVRAKNDAGASAWSQVRNFITQGVPPAPPTLVSPANGATSQPMTLTLQWNAPAGAASYHLQVATDTAFANMAADDSTLTTVSQAIGPLAKSTTYYWRVKAKNAQGASGWSPVWKFATEDVAQIGAPISMDTKSGYRKSNQGKVFYYDSQWWALASSQADGRWYVWRYNRSDSWVKTIRIASGSAVQCDAVVNVNNGKLYVFGSHKTTSYFWRFSYAGGTWKKDAGYPVILADFANPDQNNPASLVRAKNGEWWIFRIHNKILQAKRSANDGQAWSAIINVKTGLTTTYGTTDAAAFTAGGNDFVGVAYGESGTIGSKFGFLHHRDGDPEAAWTDESSSLTFFGKERAFNNVCLTADDSSNLYMMTRNNNVGGSLPRNTLYKRTNAGAWKKFKINSGALANWKTPAIAIDKSNNRIYCMGVNMATGAAEYKTCLSGQEATLNTASARVLFAAPGASFDNLSVPAPHSEVTAVSGLMVCGDNITAGDIWFSHLPIGNPAPLNIGAVTVASDEVNANATYTIPLTLSNTGKLSANIGTLHFRFPGNTVVPNTMAASQVLVDGTPATKLIANNGTKQVSITTPVNLSNNKSFFLVFNTGAGLLNPTAVNAHKLTAWTSEQPEQVNSPSYSLVPATTTVTPAAVTLSTTDPGSPADYTLMFNLGAHGRMPAGTSTFTVKFENGTRVANAPLAGVKVNTVNAVARGDSGQRQITVTLPTTVPLGNNAAVTLFLPSSTITNPSGGNYRLTVATSVETTAVASLPYAIPYLTGQPISGTTKNFNRSNQSKMFYHDGNWWITAQAKDDLKWYLWKFDGATWTRTTQIYDSAKPRPDCVLDAAINKAFILLPGGSTTYFLRLSYASDNWTIDAGYPYAVPNFAQKSEMNLVRAGNGNLWLFMIKDSDLLAKRSSTGGQTWSATLTLKNNLNKGSGLTDAVKFVYDGANHIGVGYAENSAPGSIYGFLRHKDSDPETVWTDETSAIPQFTGTTSDNHISMLAHNDNILMIVKTNGGGPSATNVGLLRRDPTGAWFQYPILLSQGWTRPILAIDQTHNRMYVFGTRESGIKVGEMKNVAFGDFDQLLTAPIDTIFSNDADNFFDSSVAAHLVDGTMNLLVCNSNTTQDEVWYNLINLSGAPKAASGEHAAAKLGEAENLDGVQVYPNPFNPETFFRFNVPAQQPVKLQIFSLNGQLVRTLVDEDLPQGIHQRRWNGHNDAGYRVASGVYWYRLQAGAKVYNGRMQMIK